MLQSLEKAIFDRLNELEKEISHLKRLSNKVSLIQKDQRTIQKHLNGHSNITWIQGSNGLYRRKSTFLYSPNEFNNTENIIEDLD